MKTHLLDINVLIALAWPNHVHHQAAHNWFKKHNTEKWATCPVTQLGFLRISSNPKIIEDAVSPAEALAFFEKMTSSTQHIFWPDDLSLTDKTTIQWKYIVGHRQFTDAYLLGLARKKQGTLVTLDKKISALIPLNSPLHNHIEFIEVD